MGTLGFHIVLRLGDDRVIAPSPLARRRVARAIATLSRTFGILSWKLADTHLHIVLVGDEAMAAELIRRLRIWFTTALRIGVPLELQRRKPLAGQGHLIAAFHYALRQDSRHGVETDTFQEGSAIVDILGLRVVSPEIAARVREHLPRLGRAELLPYLGVDHLEEEVHLDHLLESTLAAFGIAGLRRDAVSVDARKAAVHASQVPDRSRPAIATLLDVHPDTITRIAGDPLTPRHVRAVRLQMALRAAIRADTVLFVRQPDIVWRGHMREPALPTA